MSVDECQDCIDAEAFEEWQQFGAYHEPFGDEWRQAGLIAAIIAQANARKGKRFRAEDFMPLVREAQQQTPEQMLAVLRFAAAGLAGS